MSEIAVEQVLVGEVLVGDASVEGDAPHAAGRLMSAAAVRERAELIFAAGQAGKLDRWAVDLDRLGAAADEVVATMRTNYPTLAVPYHSRWRHFEASGFDRWGTLDHANPWTSPRARARSAFDLAIVSVLLDAGAGPGWSYHEGRTEERLTRSEGLAVASFDMFIAGSFSARPDDPYRVDAETLVALEADELARAFQVTPDNPLVGLDGRAALLRRLGETILDRPDLFGPAGSARPGGLFDLLAGRAADERLEASAVLSALLMALGPVWPGRLQLDGVDLGDTWRHPAIVTDDATNGLMPFHKLSQWLAYSLIEPLEEAEIGVTDLDGLTGLPEYRNGGLFVDTGVLRLKDGADAGRDHEVGSALVVEWRALTVALLDRVAVEIRRKLDRDAETLPLAQVLEGGTWAAGRRLARTLRPGGAPPIRVISDGTVF